MQAKNVRDTLENGQLSKQNWVAERNIYHRRL